MSLHATPAEVVRWYASRGYDFIVFTDVLEHVEPDSLDATLQTLSALCRWGIFLVISCPCALVISIPLGYFGGIGHEAHFWNSTESDPMWAGQTYFNCSDGTLVVSPAIFKYYGFSVRCLED